MKTTQYAKLEKEIASADRGGIRARWLYGLRLLRDPEMMSPSGKSLRHGATEKLIATAEAIGEKLSEREIQWRLQAARAYSTETQIRNAVTDFKAWRDLIQAGFPAYDAAPDEPAADHRTEAERDQDRGRALMDLIGEQDALFPLRDFEPVTTTLKELVDYTDAQDGITARFAARGRKRRAYLERLITAASNDLSMTWLEAANRLPEEAEAMPVMA